MAINSRTTLPLPQSATSGPTRSGREHSRCAHRSWSPHSPASFTAIIATVNKQLTLLILGVALHCQQVYSAWVYLPVVRVEGGVWRGRCDSVRLLSLCCHSLFCLLSSCLLLFRGFEVTFSPYWTFFYNFYYT